MDNKTSKIGFRLNKITTEQFAVIEANFENDSEIDIQMNFRFAADQLQKLIGVFASFTFESKQKQFLIIEAGCHFSIDPDSWSTMLNDSANELKVPKGFMQHMSVLTVGTARGILHAKTENTCYNKYHLPTINFENIIKKDSVFKFENKEVSKEI